MRNHRFGFSPWWAFLAVLLVSGLLATPGCGDKATDPQSDIDLAPFKLMARDAQCAETRNRLFLIDHNRVFWDRAGTCVDAGFAQTLFGGTADSILCERYETIGGVITNYEDDTYQVMFDTMVANLDEADLGLGEGHSVQSVPF